jgi:hypothetical protein
MLTITIDTNADPDREVRPHHTSGLSDHGQYEANAVGSRGAPVICAPIEIGRKKFVNQVPVCTVDLCRVEPSLFGPANGVGKCHHELFDLMLDERVGTGRLVGILDRRRGHHGVRIDAMSRCTGMVDLRETASSLGMNYFGSAAQTREHDCVIVGNALGSDRREALAVPVRSRRTGAGANGVPIHSPAGVDAEQTRPAPRTFLQIAKIACFAQPGAMRREDDTIADGEVTDFEGLKKPSKPSRLLL